LDQVKIGLLILFAYYLHEQIAVLDTFNMTLSID